MSQPGDEIDSLHGLEDRILKAVALIQKLKEENRSLRDQLKDSDAEVQKVSAALEGFQSATSSSEKELDLLRSERKQIKNRIEKLLGQMDRLAES